MRYSLSDYSVTARQKGWGPGWPTDRWSDMARVKAPSGTAVNVHRRIAVIVQRLFAVTESRGYVLRQADTGAYVNRAIAGTQTPSNHSWGLALDLNWRTNPVSYDGIVHTDFPDWLVPLWETWGFASGQKYHGSGYRDAMHLEFMGGPDDADELTDAVKNLIAGTTAPKGDDLPGTEQEWQDVRAAVARIDTRTAHLDVQGMQAIARLDAAVPRLLSSLAAAGVEDEKRDAAVLGVVTALAKNVSPPVLAAELAKFGVALNAETIARAVRVNLGAALSGALTP